MLLTNITRVNDGLPCFILLGADKILATGTGKNTVYADPFTIDFAGAIAFPGLINSHEHLDFNCFSPLGQKTYLNYTEWGKHIHSVYKTDINATLKIPPAMRVAWGVYKNLLAGITTVVNHGPVLNVEDPLINIYQENQNLHSVKFQKNWKWKLNNPLSWNRNCVIHTGEGTDQQSAEEIDELLKWNLLNRKLVGVHAVAMNTQQAKRFTALVWCPESNNILLNRQADMAQLKTVTQLVFGTDATLTGHWNAWHHLRLARSLKLLTDAELFETVTGSPAALWKLNKGSIAEGADADIVIAKSTGSGFSWDAFFALNPQDILLVLQKGSIRLFDETILPQLKNGPIDCSLYHPVSINGSLKYVEGNLPALIRDIRRFHPGVKLPSGICESTQNAVHA